MASLDDELVALYGVSITGVKRTRDEMAKLDNAIKLLRSTKYMETSTASEARFGSTSKLLRGKEDIFVASVDDLEGRVQTVAASAMAAGVARGKEIQAATLRAAETKKGLSGRPKGRKGTGREVTGSMISEISTNVETQKTTAVTNIVGWHGWRRYRKDYVGFQEKGTKGRASGEQFGSLKRKVKKRRDGSAPGRGVPAANSLGAAIIVVREYLKAELGRLKK